MRKEPSISVRIFYPKFDRKELIQKLKKKIEELAKEIPLSVLTLDNTSAVC